jgi:hypothetical protein
MSDTRFFSLNSNEKIFFERTLFLGLPSCVVPEKMSPALAELVPQHPFDAYGPSNCMPRAHFFSLNSNEKILFERTLFLGLPSCVVPEKMSPALAELVPQRPQHQAAPACSSYCPRALHVRSETSETKKQANLCSHTDNVTGSPTSRRGRR